MSETLGILLVAICAIAGYVVVSAVLARGSLSSKRTQSSRQDADAERETDFAEEWHQVLNVSPAASLAEIRAAFRTEIAKYHPDRVATLGSELRALAESRSKRINNAYMEGLRLRGGRGSARR